MISWRLCVLFLLPCVSFAHAQLDVRVVADIPSSLQITDPNHTRQQLLTAIIKAIPEKSRSGIWLYGQQVNRIVPLQQVDQIWRAQALEKIQTMKAVTADNDLDAAIKQSTLYWLDANNQDEKHLILLIDSNSSKAKASLDQITALAKRGVQIHVIAHSDIPDPVFYKKISELTHGSWVHHLPSALPEKINELMQRITHEASVKYSDTAKQSDVEKSKFADNEESIDRVPPTLTKIPNPLAIEPEFVYSPEYKKPTLKDESALLAQLAIPVPEETKQLPPWLQQEEQARLSAEISAKLASEAVIESEKSQPVVASILPQPTVKPDVNMMLGEQTTLPIAHEKMLKSDPEPVIDSAPVVSPQPDAVPLKTIEIIQVPEKSTSWRVVELFMIILNCIVVALFFIGRTKKIKQPKGVISVEQTESSTSAIAHPIFEQAQPAVSQTASEQPTQPEPISDDLLDQKQMTVIQSEIVESAKHTVINEEKRSENLSQAAEQIKAPEKLLQAMPEQAKAPEKLLQAVPEQAKAPEKLLQAVPEQVKAPEKLLQAVPEQAKSPEKLLQSSAVQQTGENQMLSLETERTLPQEAVVNVEDFLMDNPVVAEDTAEEDPLVRVQRLADTLQQLVDASPDHYRLDLDAWIKQQGPS